MTEASIVVRATVVLAIGLAVVGASTRASASTRSLWLAVTFGALLLLPIASAALPTARIPVPLLEASTTRLLTQQSPVAQRVAPLRSAGPRTSRRVAPRSLAQWLFGLWLVGAVATALPIGLAIAAAAQLRRRGTSWPRGAAALRALAQGDVTRRPILVIRDEAVHIPCTVAFMRPAIVFPADASNWSDADIQRVLTHEFEHVRRGDWLVHIAARLACALYWFHPLAWLALRRLRVETERACDDAVVRVGDAAAYAELLVNLASRLSAATRAPALAIVGRGELSARVSSILAGGRRRARTSVASRWLAFTVGIAVAGMIAAAQLVTAPVHAAQQQSTPVGEILPPQAANIGTELENGAFLSGVLYDPFGKPLGGILLGIESLQFGDPPVPPRSSPFYRATTTDASGRFSFERVPPGLYGLAAPTTDFVPGEQLILRKGERAVRDIHMKIDTVTGAVTVCRDCQPRTDAFALPDSIRQEFERDEQLALSAAVTAPEPITSALTGEAPARYPWALEDSNLEGRAVVEGLIGASGSGQAMRVTSSTDAALEAAAMEVLASERWKPAFVRGVAVDAPFRVEVNFILK